MTNRRAQLISDSSEWTFELVEQYEQAIGEVAHSYQLDTYRNQIEIISSEQMIDAYSSVGMPVGYHHWSFGKQFINVEKNYQKGRMGLAYELVINSDPCIAYLMEENTMMMQALVIAHACYGHNSFFKGNYLFRTWTDATSIIDYIIFAKNYITRCEERYGIEEVEKLLDSCHALMDYGVDRYKRPYPISASEERQRQREREEHRQHQVNELWRTIPKRKKQKEKEEKFFPEEPQENLLYFIEKNAPLLEPWQREIVRIVRKIAQYFYPQKQTQVMNEGWATFWHHTILNTLYDQGRVNEGFIIEFLQSHTGVVYQPPFNSDFYSGINPYALGFAMMQDIKRICQNPTDEDKKWFPDFAGAPWLATLHYAMKNFKDESFILQFLSPKIIRDFKFFSLLDDDEREEYEISAIHDDSGYRSIRNMLSQQYNLSYREPDIQVYKVNIKGDRSLTLRHYQHARRPLEAENTDEVLKHLRRLWSFDVSLESMQGDKIIKTYHCHENKKKPNKNELVPASHQYSIITP